MIFNDPHDALRHHVTGAVERGEAEPIGEQPVLDPSDLLTIETAEQARDYAINWQTWFGQCDRYMSEHVEWGSAFEALAERFPELADEFRENAII